MPAELQQEVSNIVQQTKTRSRWPIQRTLAALGIAPASYYRWCKRASVAAPGEAPARMTHGSYYALLPNERQAIMAYALAHPEVRHRELAWKMLDDEVCAVSSSSVYRVLSEAQLMCTWQPKRKVKGSGRPDAPTRPDQLWQTDIRYTKVAGRNYYLLSFLDVYSRYIVYHELLRNMDGLSVSIAAAAALATLPAGVKPTIQSDHGSGFIAKEFAGVLAENDVTHQLIRPHTPTDNAEIERCQRTIGERLDEHVFEDCAAATSVVDGVIGYYNHQRLHSALNFLRPVDYYRGKPAALLAERRRKLSMARDLRRQENLRLRQRLISWPEPETVAYAQRRTVSL